MKTEQYTYIGIGGKQIAYWWLLESKIVSLEALSEGFEPLPEIIVGRN